jgi:hypothetical protein
MPICLNNRHAVRRETLAALARIYYRHATDTADTASRVIHDAQLNAALANLSTIQHAITSALEAAAKGDTEPLRELASLAMRELAETRFEATPAHGRT